MAGLIIVCCLLWPIFWLVLHIMEVSVRKWRIENDRKIKERKNEN